MARLCAYYSLCPLIDQRSLLGVAEDSTSGCVIVTLGKNIVIRYKLLHQKQISSWSSREKLSSPVIYDAVGSQYVAVFNRSQLRLWTENEENLDKIKKIKFHQQIHCVIPQTEGNEPLILFSNGAVCPLRTAVESRKKEIDSSLLDANEVIEDYRLVEYENFTFITLFCRNSSDVPHFCVVPVSGDIQSMKLKVEWKNFRLMGQTVMKQDSSCNFLTLWSDGRLCSLPFHPQPSPELPGTLVSIVRAVSTKHPVALVPLSSSHMAIYGADPSEEGASLTIYNVQFGVVQSRHHFKLFASPPRLWCAGTNLLIATAHNLVVVPYRLEAQQLSAMVGAHCSGSAQEEHDSDVQELHHTLCSNWVANGRTKDAPSRSNPQIPEALKEQLQALEAEGCCQSMMVQKLLPQLLKASAISELNWCIKYFTDIPEGSLVQIILFCLENVTKTDKEGPYHKLLNTVLHAPFSDVCMLPSVRTAPLHLTLSLLHYLAEEIEADVPEVELYNLIEWASLLLDAHYQRYLLSGDPQVLKLLLRIRELVVNQIDHMNELNGLLPLLQQLQEGKLSKPQFVNKLYSIESLRLY
ncbi:hypothetical protein B7P43_G17189 [Cryptotermes secundus]|uniref:Nucleolar protein 11 n=1 Tax=Cryptotermes secundus TaxID=105785 RepID=A0A2J7QSR0_9NEOP|nr:nucleolar protein 11 [Cryptotermes secundus]PNF31620.1 hypothetical protein B7P43_G17189 [Cryptotermes secundus]PNF31621.1 hypothetical protein B7P43_G17189 [Cryptotermes secundus]